jgi:hypothetical protein
VADQLRQDDFCRHKRCDLDRNHTKRLNDAHLKTIESKKWRKYPY